MDLAAAVAYNLITLTFQPTPKIGSATPFFTSSRNGAFAVSGILPSASVRNGPGYARGAFRGDVQRDAPRFSSASGNIRVIKYYNGQIPDFASEMTFVSRTIIAA